MSRKKRKDTGKSEVYYTIYDARTDEVVNLGTADEIAAARGVKRGSVYSLVSKAVSGRNRKYAVVKDAYEEKL
jgi:hypothetical protein